MGKHYSTAELRERAIEAIKSNKLIFITDVAAMVGVDKKTFSNHGLNVDPEILELLMYNKILVRSNLRKKWYNSDNPTLQLALYKLCATTEELQILNNQTVINNVTNKVEFNESYLLEVVKDIVKKNPEIKKELLKVE